MAGWASCLLVARSPTLRPMDLRARGQAYQLSRPVEAPIPWRGAFRSYAVESLHARVGPVPAAGPALTRSEAEARFLELVRRAGLPEPEMNVRVGPWEADAFWRTRGLIAEVDGFQYHSSREAFERDRRKDLWMGERGFLVLRFTWRQIVEEPEYVTASLSRVLTEAWRPR